MKDSRHTPLPSWGSLSFFFFNDTATTEIYTLSLHDALPISVGDVVAHLRELGDQLDALGFAARKRGAGLSEREVDRKSTRLNSSHSQISYAVFCLKKKKKKHASSCPWCETKPY